MISIGMVMIITGSAMLGGCGSDSELGEVIAFVGNTESGEGGPANAEIWQGLTDYANETNRELVTYVPESGSVRDAELAMKSAIDDGADVIVCSGTEMNYAVYEVQKIEKHTQFVLIDGVPAENKEGGDKRIRGNTCSIIFSREIAGFLAGYAAVKDGCRFLGFYGGSKDEDTVRYGSGFIQGANQAAGELKLKKDEVVIQYKYMTSNAISPAQVSGIVSWFQEGCQVIAVAGGGAELVAEQGAVRANGKIITDDMNAAAGASIMAAAGINYTNAARQALTMIDAGSISGGESSELGVAENCIYLNMEGSTFNTFGQADYDDVLARIENGEITVTSQDVTKLTPEDTESGNKKKTENTVQINNVTIEERP